MASFRGSSENNPINLDSRGSCRSEAIDLTLDDDETQKPLTPALLNLNSIPPIGPQLPPYWLSRPRLPSITQILPTSAITAKTGQVNKATDAQPTSKVETKVSEKAPLRTMPLVKVDNDDKSIQTQMGIQRLIMEDQPISMRTESGREQTTTTSRTQEASTNQDARDDGTSVLREAPGKSSLLSSTMRMPSPSKGTPKTQSAGKPRAIKSAPVTAAPSRRKLGTAHVAGGSSIISSPSEKARRDQEPSQTPLPANGSEDVFKTPSLGPPSTEARQTQQAMAAPAQIPSKSRHVFDVRDFNVTRSDMDSFLQKQLKEFYESRACLVRIALQKQRTSRERELRKRKLLRIPSPTFPTLPAKYIQQISPFEDMKTSRLPSDAKSSKEKICQLSQEIFTKAKPKDAVIRTTCSALPTVYRSTAVNIPNFKEYAGLKDNLLAENDSKLLTWPYFQDENDASREKLYDQLPKAYEMTNEGDPSLNLRNEQCRVYEPFVNDLVKELGVTWETILFLFLASKKDILRINDFSSPGRAQFETFFSYWISHRGTRGLDVHHKTWQTLLTTLPKPSVKALRISALFCSSFSKETDGFSIWHIAKQCTVLQDYISRKTQDPTSDSTSTLAPSITSYRDIMCRVCHQHNCLFHGELRQEPEDYVIQDDLSEASSTSSAERLDGVDTDEGESDSSSQTDSKSDADKQNSVPAHETDDSIVEKVINYKRVLNTSAATTYSEDHTSSKKSFEPPHSKFNVSWWYRRTHTARWENRNPFYPCNHEGDCKTAQCRCFRERITCEKTCACSKSCTRRFPGCTCGQQPGKRLCGTDKCPCHKLNRECDADRCVTCGATEILDPVNQHNHDVGKGRCCNVAVQRGIPKKTVLGHSEVHGFGLYTGEDIKKDEFIGEYKGEVLTGEESDRRVIIYDYQQTMYLFRLNIEQEVDATYAGNKTRFINNADKKLTNCYPKNLFCDSVFRLAIFAKTDLKAGTELFFHYNYPEDKTINFKQPTGKPAGTGKLVAVKESTRKAKPSSSVSSYKGSQSSLSSKSRASTPEHRKQTARGRALLAAKTSANNITEPTEVPRKRKATDEGSERPAKMMYRTRKLAPKETAGIPRSHPMIGESQASFTNNFTEMLEQVLFPRNEVRDRGTDLSVSRSDGSREGQPTQGTRVMEPAPSIPQVNESRDAAEPQAVCSKDAQVSISHNDESQQMQASVPHNKSQETRAPSNQINKPQEADTPLSHNNQPLELHAPFIRNNECRESHNHYSWAPSFPNNLSNPTWDAYRPLSDNDQSWKAQPHVSQSYQSSEAHPPLSYSNQPRKEQVPLARNDQPRTALEPESHNNSLQVRATQEVRDTDDEGDTILESDTVSGTHSNDKNNNQTGENIQPAAGTAPTPGPPVARPVALKPKPLLSKDGPIATPTIPPPKRLKPGPKPKPKPKSTPNKSGPYKQKKPHKRGGYRPGAGRKKKQDVEVNPNNLL